MTSAEVTTGDSASASGASPPAHDDAATPLLQLRGISKSFGAVQALQKVDLDIMSGKVTALVGDNGAGKSSLVKTIAGLWEPDQGQILWEGDPVRLTSPKEAERLGITTIYQDLALCDNLEIVQNMFLGHESLRHFTLDEASMEIAARQTLKELSVTTVRSIRQPVASLSGGQRQSVAVAKAVMSNAKLVIMDEPTAALGVAQTRMVLDLIKTLAGRNVTVLMISHNLIDVFEVADYIAVLRLGQIVTVDAASTLDSQAVVEYMTTGRSSRVSGDSGHSGHSGQSGEER
jgi:ABC-type sugar transport system ATPase subunit